MSLNTAAILAIFNAVESHAEASGYFETVNRHEIENAPGHGLHVEIWLQRLGPVAAASGLAATTGLLLINNRIRAPITQESADAIDPYMLEATLNLMGAYSGDFEFGGNVRNVDLLGAHGVPLQFIGGYLPQGSSLSRVYTIDLPLVINDLWSQSA